MQPTTRRSVSAATLAAMNETNDFFNAEVVAGGNIAGLDRVYTANARILPPGAEMVQGRESIKAFWAAAIPAMNVKTAVLSTVEASQEGEGILEIGRAELGFENGASAAVKYIVFWRKEENVWKWDVDMWSPVA